LWRQENSRIFILIHKNKNKQKQDLVDKMRKFDATGSFWKKNTELSVKNYRVQVTLQPGDAVFEGNFSTIENSK
jgi:hypothetical protein